jgi:ComF family protein
MSFASTPHTARGSARSLLSQVSAASQALLDLIFPPRCAGCGAWGTLFCEACQAQIETITPPVCPRCGHPTFDNALCAACRREPSNLDGITAVAIYAHPLREAIHTLKYRDGRALAAPLGERMADAWRQACRQADMFLPVPLHPSRLAERGYNQSLLLARVLGANVGVPVTETALVRQRATLPQVGLGWHERRQNVSGAFVCQGDVRGKRVVLIDDVCTTGATLEACAAALKAGDATSIWALTLARARWEPGVPAPDAAPARIFQG